MWLSRSPSARELADRVLVDRITDIHGGSRGTFGVPRIGAELSFEGVCVGRKRVARLMRQARIQGVHRRRRVTTTRRPDRVIHHSDRGRAQYTSTAFRARCRAAGIAMSMGRRGDAYDNAVAESFFATLETEPLDRHTFPTRDQARSAVFDHTSKASTTPTDSTPPSDTTHPPTTKGAVNYPLDRLAENCPQKGGNSTLTRHNTKHPPNSGQVFAVTRWGISVIASGEFQRSSAGQDSLLEQDAHGRVILTAKTRHGRTIPDLLGG